MIIIKLNTFLTLLLQNYPGFKNIYTWQLNIGPRPSDPASPPPSQPLKKSPCYSILSTHMLDLYSSKCVDKSIKKHRHSIINDHLYTIKLYH